MKSSSGYQAGVYFRPVSVFQPLEQEKEHMSLQRCLSVFGAITLERYPGIDQRLRRRFPELPCWPALVSRHGVYSPPIEYAPVDDSLKMALPQRACIPLLHSDSPYIQSSWTPPFRLMFGPSPCPGHYSRHSATMTSADFCSITCPVTRTGAMKPLLQLLPIVRLSSPSTASGDARTLVSRYGPKPGILAKDDSCM